jgi:alkanesulfonate monooxygenase SsuD/methylene tetrahydromethanopterin reductase-like flavin-dependent oxidoreductase (luciferase family)
MCDIDIDLTQSRPLRIGVAVGDQVLWGNDTAAERIRGVDLSDIARKAASVRRNQPDVDVVADIDVVIAVEACAARAILNLDADETGDSTLLYVGTPPGLASLISDIHALGITDGAVLIPRTAGMGDLIHDAVLPLLHSEVELPAASREAYSA